MGARGAGIWFPLILFGSGFANWCQNSMVKANVEKLIVSGGFASLTPINVLINTNFHMFGAIVDPERSAAPPILADLPTSYTSV